MWTRIKKKNNKNPRESGGTWTRATVGKGRLSNSNSILPGKGGRKECVKRETIKHQQQQQRKKERNKQTKTPHLPNASASRTFCSMVYFAVFVIHFRSAPAQKHLPCARRKRARTPLSFCSSPTIWMKRLIIFLRCGFGVN